MAGQHIAFLGLGVMGYPMAGFLQAAGHHVTVYNRTTSRAQQWVDQTGGKFAETPRQAVEQAAVVFCCVGNDDDLREVTLGSLGAFHGLNAGTVFVDHTTVSAKIARELAEEATAIHCQFLDAPISGGQAGAESGALTVMIGGDQDAFDHVSDLIGCYAKSMKLLGPVGSGQLAKMVNQICIAGVVQGLAEGLHFARSSGLDPEAVIEVISKGAAQSWQMDNRYKTMLSGEYEHGFAVDWMRKDLAIVLEEAHSNYCQLPLTEIVDQFYSDVQAMGGGRWDTSSLLARLEAMKNSNQ